MPTTPPLPGSLSISFHRGLSYEAGVALQKEILGQMRADPASPQRLLLVEHRPVITLGRNYKPADLLVSEAGLAERGIDLVKTNRGGEATYHGPGQWTLYPLLRLNDFCKDLHKYMRRLEDLVIRYLTGHEIASSRREGKTGVWVGSDKLAAVGIAVSSWISWHGVAVNIQPDLRHFTELIVPCGIPASVGGVTSLAKCTGEQFDMKREGEVLAETFCRVFGVSDSVVEAPGVDA